MDLFGIGTTLGAIGDTVIGGLNYANSKQAFEFNKKQQEYANKWNEYVYEDQKKREDNAVQRQSADYEAAGFNKLLAAGQAGAGAGTAVQASGSNLQHQQTEMGLTEKAAAIYDTVGSMISMKNDIATSETQRALMKAQIYDIIENARGYEGQRDLTKQEIENKKKEGRLIDFEAEYKDHEVDKLLYDLERSMDMNIRTTDATDGRANTLQGLINDGIERIGNIYNMVRGRGRRESSVERRRRRTGRGE